MEIRNNHGELVGEINSGMTQNGDWITTNTMYDRGRPVMQTVVIRQTNGTVQTTNVLGRKILP